MNGGRNKRRSITHRWLYERRAFRFWKAETFEKVLQQIAAGSTKGTPAGVAADWLYEARKKELEVGYYFDHERNEPTNVKPPHVGGPRRKET